MVVLARVVAIVRLQHPGKLESALPQIVLVVARGAPAVLGGAETQALDLATKWSCPDMTLTSVTETIETKPDGPENLSKQWSLRLRGHAEQERKQNNET